MASTRRLRALAPRLLFASPAGNRLVLEVWGRRLRQGAGLFHKGFRPCTVPRPGQCPEVLTGRGARAIGAARCQASSQWLPETGNSSACTVHSVLRAFKGVRAPTFLPRVKPRQLSHCTASCLHWAFSFHHTQNPLSEELNRPFPVPIHLPASRSQPSPDLPFASPADLPRLPVLHRPPASSFGDWPESCPGAVCVTAF